MELDDATAWLAHYTSADTAFSKIVSPGKLLMNPYSKMRDPFENQNPTLHGLSAWGSDREGQERKFWQIQAAVSRCRDTWRLLSLTEGEVFEGDVRAKLFGCPWARPRMWEQYAGNHAGVCLLFDRHALLANADLYLGPRGNYRHGPVQYTAAGFGSSEAAQGFLEDFGDSQLGVDVGRHVERHFAEFFLLKTLDWSSEREYRLVFEPHELVGMNPPLEDGVLFAYGTALRYVILGERFPKWQIPAAARIVEAAGAELRQMAWTLGKPWPAKLAGSPGSTHS